VPGGIKIKHAELKSRLDNLDIDEGIRIENKGKKFFINRRASGDYVVQDGNEFHYLDNARQVIAVIKPPKSSAIWFY